MRAEGGSGCPPGFPGKPLLAAAGGNLEVQTLFLWGLKQGVSVLVLVGMVQGNEVQCLLRYYLQ